MRGPGSIPSRGKILLLDFLFSRSKAPDANIGRNYCQFRLVLKTPTGCNKDLVMY